jgi:hypothetical protein
MITNPIHHWSIAGCAGESSMTVHGYFRWGSYLALELAAGDTVVGTALFGHVRGGLLVVLAEHAFLEF